jgi:3-oxoadipate enol-lactonase
MTDKKIRLPGTDARLAYDLRRQSGGPAVVQLHGLTSSRARDSAFGLDLGSALDGARVLRFDARGHGESTGTREPADYAWPALAEDLLTVLDEVFPGEGVHGIGQSMGTATLLTAATMDQARFASLTLGIPPTIWDTRAAQSENYLQNADFVERFGREAFGESERGAPQPPAVDPDRPFVLPDVRDEWLPSAFRGAAATDLPPADDVAQLNIPALLLAWIDDPAHPESSARALRRVLPDTEFELAATPAEVTAWPARIAEFIGSAPRA